jgi:hypothetical protein
VAGLVIGSAHTSGPVTKFLIRYVVLNKQSNIQ